MSFEIRVLKDKELKDWDGLLRNSKYGTVFHILDWLMIAKRLTKSKLYPLVGIKDDVPVVLFPIFFKKKGVIKAVFSPPPKAGIQYLGPSFLKYDELKQGKKENLLAEFQKGIEDFVSRELKANYVLYRFPPDFIDARAFKWKGYETDILYTYKIDISKGEKEVLGIFKKSLRKDLNRTQKKVSVEEGKKEDISLLYDILSKRYDEQDMELPISKEYMFELFKTIHPKYLRIFTANMDGKKIGALLTTCYNGVVAGWQSTGKINLKGLAVLDLLHWEAMKWAMENGYDQFELMGANTERLCKYKSKYNPDLKIYLQIKKRTAISGMAESVYKKLIG